MHHAEDDRTDTLPKLALTVLVKTSCLKSVCINGAEVEVRNKGWLHDHNKIMGMILDI